MARFKYGSGCVGLSDASADKPSHGFFAAKLETILKLNDYMPKKAEAFQRESLGFP